MGKLKFTPSRLFHWLGPGKDKPGKDKGDLAAKWKFRFTLIAVFCFGVAFAMVKPSPPPHYLPKWLFGIWDWATKEGLSKIGDAMMIAPILALLVDAAAKQSLLSEFAKDVSIHIIGRYLPRELREHINGYLTVDIVRLDLDLVYTITELGDGMNIELETVMTSDLHNYSFKEIKTPIFVSVSKSLNPAAGNTLLTEVSAGQFTYRAGDPTDCLKSTEDDQVYSTVLTLPHSQPGTLPHGTRCIVKSKEYFPCNSQNGFIAVYPVIGTSVTVIKPAGYKVILDPTFTNDEPPAPEEVSGRCRWNIETPILQGQGFFLKWSKKSQNPTTSHPEDTHNSPHT